MVVWSVLVLANAILLASAAVPDPPSTGITTIGSLKLATATDCTGVVAFSAVNGTVDNTWITGHHTLVDKVVGFDSKKGVFTTHCPGLYQFSFSGYGSNDLKLTLKGNLGNVGSWDPILTVGPGGGSGLILLNVKIGDQLAISVPSGELVDGVTFSGHRIAKN